MPDLKLNDNARRQLAELLGRINREQLVRGQSASGQVFPPHITLIRSGALLHSIQRVVSGDEISLTSGLPYAGVMQARFDFLGLSPESQARFEAEAQPILEAALELPDTEI